jgi:hypothetical protein
VWSREIPQFLARNLKHHSRSELCALQVEFGPLPMGKPEYGGIWWDAKFESTQFKKKVPQSEFVCKSYDHFTEARPSYGSVRQNTTRNQNRVRQKFAVCDGKR